MNPYEIRTMDVDGRPVNMTLGTHYADMRSLLNAVDKQLFQHGRSFKNSYIAGGQMKDFNPFTRLLARSLVIEQFLWKQERYAALVASQKPVRDPFGNVLGYHYQLKASWMTIEVFHHCRSEWTEAYYATAQRFSER